MSEKPRTNQSIASIESNASRLAGKDAGSGNGAGLAINSESAETIARCVNSAVNQFLEDMKDEPVSDLHELVMRQAEKPLIEVVMHHCDGNQSRASRLLGINRNTLKKKLVCYGIKSSDH